MALNSALLKCTRALQPLKAPTALGQPVLGYRLTFSGLMRVLLFKRREAIAIYDSNRIRPKNHIQLLGKPHWRGEYKDGKNRRREQKIT